MLLHKITPKSTHSELTTKKRNKLLGVHFVAVHVHRCLQWHKVDITVSARHFPRKYDSNMAVCVQCVRPI